MQLTRYIAEVVIWYVSKFITFISRVHEWDRADRVPINQLLLPNRHTRTISTYK